MIQAKEILDQLDKCTTEYIFPMLDNGHVYPAGTKLTAYRDDKRWVIIIETIGFSYRGGGHDGISNCLHVYGNCLNYQPGTRNENFIYLTDNANNCNTFDDEQYFYLNPRCTTFILRGEVFPLYQDRELYRIRGIEIKDPERINAFEFLRLLDALHHDKLVATKNEIKDRIPDNLTKMIELDQWFHPDVVNEQLPSMNETFRQVAKILETGNIKYYKPTNQPNTHWKNWPEGGTL